MGLDFTLLSEACHSLVTFSLQKTFFRAFVDLGIYFFIFGSFIIIGSANAVNLTDGLDGLAIVPVMVVVSSFAFISYVTGNINFSEYLQIQTKWIHHSYVGCLQQAPNEHLLKAITRAALKLITGIWWDLGESPPKIF